MKLFFADDNRSALADSLSPYFIRTKAALLRQEGVSESGDPETADAIILKEKWSYKDFRYRKRLLEDPLVSGYTGKVFTINDDDAGTGFLKGLYTNISSAVFHPARHVAVPYIEYFNEFVSEGSNDLPEPTYLACWRGNLISSPMRTTLLKRFGGDPRFLIETSESWLNHGEEEKKRYVEMIRSSRFSLCPSGWGPSSFRIYESMALGRCPVIIADRFVPPAGPDWKSFSLFVPEKHLGSLDRILEENKAAAEAMGRKAQEAWNQFFKGEKTENYYVKALLELMQRNAGGMIPDETEIWEMRSFYRANGWTFGQRLRSKVRRVMKKLYH